MPPAALARLLRAWRGLRVSLARLLRAWRGLRVSLALLSAGILAWTVSRALPVLAPLAPRALAGDIGATLSRRISIFTGALPFSVAEVLLACYVLLLLVHVARGMDRAADERRWRAAFRRGALRVARHTGIVLLLFYVLWGMNYARPPFAVQAGWPAWQGIEADELRTLLVTATRTVNRAYGELHGSFDNGMPTQLPEDRAALEAAIDEGWRRAATVLSLPPHAAMPYGRVKWPGSSGLLARLGLAGMYVPFTGEAHVVRGVPAMRVPLSMAHEKAHQRGVAREADANFLGYIAAAHAPDPLARYSAAMFVRQQLLNLSLSHLPADERRQLRAMLVSGVQRDIDHMLAYWLGLDGFAADIGAGINNSFLLANGIDDGVQDYRRSVFSVVSWLRRNDGAVLP